MIHLKLTTDSRVKEGGFTNNYVKIKASSNHIKGSSIINWGAVHIFLHSQVETCMKMGARRKLSRLFCVQNLNTHR